MPFIICQLVKGITIFVIPFLKPIYYFTVQDFFQYEGYEGDPLMYVRLDYRIKSMQIGRYNGMRIYSIMSTD